MPRIRSRGSLIPSYPPIGENYRTYVNDSFADRIDSTIYSGGTYSNELCIDELHKREGRGWKSGGPFDLTRVDQREILSRRVDASFKPGPIGGWYFRYRGHFRGSMPSTDHPSMAPWVRGSELSDLESYGAEAVARFRPGKPAVNFGVFLGELRDAPRLLQIRLKELRDAGSLYLNWQFGWKPFLRDLFAFFETMEQLDKEIAQFSNQYGKRIRRRGEVDSVSGKNSYPVGASLAPGGDVARTSLTAGDDTEYEKTIRFSGQFEFPSLPDLRWGPLDTVVGRLYGIRLTPDVIWNLIPWTWLIDWTWNVGDAIANFSAIHIDAMTIHYAYLMGEYKTYIVRTSTASFSTFAPDPQTFTLTCGGEKKRVRKLRVKADPYALRFTGDEVSAYRLSILAALGLSRS